MIRVEISSQSSPTQRNAFVSNYSKMVEDTIKQNERENELLRKHKIQLENEHILGRVQEKQERIELQNDLINIPKVTKVAPLSSERVLFLNQHGVNNSEKFYNINYFMSLIDEVTKSTEDGDSSEEYDFDNPPPTNPSAFPLRLDFSETGVRTNMKNQRAEKDRDERKLAEKRIETNETLPKKNTENLTNEDATTRDEEISNTANDKNTKHDDQNTPATTADKKSKKDRNTEQNTSDKKVGHGSGNSTPANRPHWMFRTIDPPEHGRYMWRSRTKFSAKPEDIEKERAAVEKETRDVLAKPAVSKEEILLNEKANNYRYKILAQHKMTSMFVPAPSSKTTTIIEETSSNLNTKTNVVVEPLPPVST